LVERSEVVEKERKNDDRSTAIHEAGHVVAHLAAGGRMGNGEATIVPDERRGTNGHAMLSDRDAAGRLLSVSSLIVGNLGGAVAQHINGEGKEIVLGIGSDSLKAQQNLWSLLFDEAEAGDQDSDLAFETLHELDQLWKPKKKRSKLAQQVEYAAADAAEAMFWASVVYAEIVKPGSAAAGTKPGMQVVARKLQEHVAATKAMLLANWTKVERIADALLEKKTVSGPELEQMFAAQI
jgi:ATP-dependent Zn protease